MVRQTQKKSTLVRLVRGHCPRTGKLRLRLMSVVALRKEQKERERRMHEAKTKRAREEREEREIQENRDHYYRSLANALIDIGRAQACKYH